MRERGSPRISHLVVEVGAHLTLQLVLPNETTPIKTHVAVIRWSAAPHVGLDFVLIEERGERLLDGHRPVQNTSRPQTDDGARQAEGSHLAHQ